MSLLSNEIAGMIFAFGDKERQDAVRSIVAKVKDFEYFAKTCRDDFDCDHDAHKYGTMCRACSAAKLMEKSK